MLLRTYIALLLLLPALLQAQALRQIIGPEQHIAPKRELSASWIMHPAANAHSHGVLLFRKNFRLGQLPQNFIIHISADNQYRLFVNGVFAARGPARSDLNHWYYETVDLVSLLRPGWNTLAVEVVNYGPKRAWSQFSQMTSLFVMGRSEREAAVNTLPGEWLCYHNEAHQPLNINWIQGMDVAFGLYVANPTDSIVGRRYPWGWERTDADEREWLPAAWANNAGTRNTQYAGGINFSGGKLLVPSPIRMTKEREEPLGSVAKISGISWREGYLNGEEPLYIPANRRVTLLVDRGHMTVGYPELTVSGGEGAVIRVRYAETLYSEDRRTKSNRNDFVDKVFIGIRDVYLPDGGLMRLFRPTWLRSFRFVELTVTTGDEPATIHRFINQFSAYDLELRASFRSDSESLNRLMEPGWRTVSICAQDILMSDAYYEQMQYIGDSKVHNLALMYLSGNDELVRNALRQADWSRIPEGLTLACYPNAFHLVIPLYSLTWIEMIHDYMMWSGDRQFVSDFLPGIRMVIDWFGRRLLQEGLLGPIGWWNYVDWSPGFPNGVPPGIENGKSALFSLQFALALDRAAEIMDFVDAGGEEAFKYRAKAEAIREAVRAFCFSSEKGLFAETPDMEDFSQHTNILAVLSGTVEGKEAQEIMRRILDDSSLHQVALFFRYYLLEALHMTGLVQYIENELAPWHRMMEMGLSTFTEVPIDWPSQRSDCHPWSAAPNIHFFSTICGIRPLSPGYKRVLVAPAMEKLSSLEAIFPHPAGNLALTIQRSGKQGLRGQIDVPEGMEVIFRWEGSETSFQSGLHEIRIR